MDKKVAWESFKPLCFLWVSQNTEFKQRADAELELRYGVVVLVRHQNVGFGDLFVKYRGSIPSSSASAWVEIAARNKPGQTMLRRAQ